MEEIVGKFLSLIDLKHLSENEEIKLDTENSKPTIVLCLKEHPYHDDALYIAKQKKAEEYMLRGQDIEILPESVFYEMIKDG